MMKSFNELYDENGKYITDSRYTEILKLDSILTEAKIPHVLEKFMDGWQVIYPKNGEERIADAIEHIGSYGSEENLLEIMGLLTPEESENDCVVGYLTAEDVFNRFKCHWESKKGGKNNGLLQSVR